MILLYVLACTYPDFLGDSNPSDTAPSDTDPSDTDPVDTDTDPLDTDVPTPCGEEPVPTSTIELDTNTATVITEAFEVTAGGPGELLVLRTGRVDRLRFSAQSSPLDDGTFDPPGVVDPVADRLGGAGDLDGDLELDLPLFRAGSPCVVHLHAFTEQPVASITVGTSARACAIVGDVTGDGHSDLVVSDLLLPGNRRGFSVWDGVALTSGSTTPWATYQLEEFQFGPLGAMQIADLDLDGVDEIVFATGGEGAGDAPAVAAVDLTPNTNPTTLTAALLRSDNQGDQGEASLALGDWDGDGDLDPSGAFWQPVTGPGAVLGHGADAATVTPLATALFRWVAGAPTSLGQSAAGIGDFDGGGCDDLALVLPEPTGGRIGVYSGTSLRGDLAEVTPAVSLAPAGNHRLDRGLSAPGDLDGDGAPDLIALGTLDGGALAAWVFFGGAR